MSYTVTNADGSALTTISPGTTDTYSTSLTLIGKNFPGYGQFLNENFVLLLENFSSGSAPSNPQEGQLWWDRTTSGDPAEITKVGNRGILKVYHSITNTWKRVSGAVASPTASAPLSADSATGDFWWDTTAQQLKVYNGTTWVIIGPAYTVATGQSGAIADQVTDTLNAQHVIVRLVVNSKTTAILSTDSAFIPNIAIPGFSSISPGLNLHNPGDSSISQTLKLWNGSADNADNLGGTAAAYYAKLNGTNPFTTSQAIANNVGLAIGTGGDLVANVAAGAVRISSITSGNNLDLYNNVGGNYTKLVSVGSDGNVRLPYNGTLSTLDSAAIVTKSYVDSKIATLGIGSSATWNLSANIVPTGNIQYNLGTPTAWWNNIYGTAIHAQYADVAERFAIDTPQPPGTIVEIGGEAEITASLDELSENILGVISTQAAYLMNSGAGSDITHPPVAVSGRVPVRVIGIVKKGDRLVSAGNGLARAGARNEISPWNVIGRALTSKTTSGEGTIEATVKLNS